GADVLGIERSELAVAAGRANAARLGIPGARFLRGAAAPELARLPAEALDAVVLDPPPAGAADVGPPLAGPPAPPGGVGACDPATLARDAGVLIAGGYRPGRVQPIDLFPHTYHIETVAEFVLK